MTTLSRVNLHIGYNKTGSSSLQAMLAERRDVLASVGIYYPISGTHNNAHYALSSALIGYPDSLPKGPPVQAAIAEDLASELNSVSGMQELVFSSEYFCCASPSQIARTKHWLSEVFPSAKVRIITYLRRHDEWFTSLFNQAEKHYQGRQSIMHDPDISSFIIYALSSSHPSPHYLKVLDSWADAFGKDAIIVRPFQRSKLNNACVCDDFLSLFDRSIPPFAKPRTNESLSEERLILTMIWNRVIGERFPQEYFLSDGSMPDRSPLPESLVSTIRLTQMQKNNIVKLFEEEYAEIKRKFIAGLDETLFDC